MNYRCVILFSLSILVAAIIGVIRFKKIDPAYYPFIICTWIASINEIAGIFITSRGQPTVINNNIYVLIESLLITWQFERWSLFSQHKKTFFLLMAGLLLTWITDSFLISGINQISFYFRLLYSFAIVLMAITVNNNLIFTFKKKLIRSPEFLICTGFILYFTYKILIETFWLYGLNNSKNFRINVYLLLTWINLFVNLIYAIALLWIPKKLRYTVL